MCRHFELHGRRAEAEHPAQAEQIFLSDRANGNPGTAIFMMQRRKMTCVPDDGNSHYPSSQPESFIAKAFFS